jgi:serine/threonine-protein kinase RsbW
MKSTYKFASTIDNISIIENLVDKIAEKNIIPEEQLGNVMVCITEAVTNAIIHGNKNNIAKNVEVEYLIENNQLIFSVKDEGVGFDFTSIPDPTLPENIEKEDGRGVFLIKNLADSIEFKNNGSEIIFKFNI